MQRKRGSVVRANGCSRRPKNASYSGSSGGVGVYGGCTFPIIGVLGWMTGIEPATTGATGRCSAVELHPPQGERAVYQTLLLVAVNEAMRQLPHSSARRSPRPATSTR